jgi:hypothetical protein
VSKCFYSFIYSYYAGLARTVDVATLLHSLLGGGLSRQDKRFECRSVTGSESLGWAIQKGGLNVKVKAPLEDVYTTVYAASTFP